MSKEMNATISRAKRGTTGHTSSGNADHGQANVPSKLKHTALDAAADAAEAATQNRLDRAAARNDRETAKRVG